MSADDSDDDVAEIEQLLTEHPDRGFAQVAAHSRHSLKRIREVAKKVGDSRSDRTRSTARTLWQRGIDEE